MKKKGDEKPKKPRRSKRFKTGFKTEWGSRAAMVRFAGIEGRTLYRWRGKRGLYFLGSELPEGWTEPYWTTGSGGIRLVWNGPEE